MPRLLVQLSQKERTMLRGMVRDQIMFTRV